MNYENLSKLGVGSLRFINDQDYINFYIKEAYNLGINYFECASFYINHNCEILFGNALQQLPREKIYIADKFYMPDFLEKKLSLEEYFNLQLEKCKTQYFDFYLFQAIDRHYLNEYFYNLITFFINKKEQGVIKNIGFSYHDTSKYINDFLEIYSWDFIQIYLNYYDWFFGESKNLYKIITEKNIPIFVMGGQKGGLLSNNKNLAIKFLKCLKNVKMILDGNTNINFLKENFSIINDNNNVLKDEEFFTLYMHSFNIKNSSLIPCVNCNYCFNICIKNINIPFLFDLHNKIVKDVITAKEKEQFFNILKSDVGPEQCVECKNCEKYCPQHLPISQYMKTKLILNRV